MCMRIVRSIDRGSQLVEIKNKDGETPLFLAALHGKKDTFLYLNSFASSDENISRGCVRRESDGNTILHCAIRGEYFDLAIQIIHLYEADLVHSVNEKGFTPLHVLATKPSAFRGGCKLDPWRRIIYECLYVDRLEACDNYGQPSSKKSNRPNYTIVANSREADLENPHNPRSTQTNGGKGNLFQANYTNCYNFVKLLYNVILVFTGRGHAWTTEILKQKQKHRWSVQVLDELLKVGSILDYEDSGDSPYFEENEDAIYKLQLESNQDQHHVSQENKETTTIAKRKKETALLIAAKNGITEMVERILENFPMAVYDEDENEKNVVLLAVENRRVEVFKLLLNKHSQNESVFRKVDSNGNGALHLAATKGNHMPWPIPGDALQMQWEIRWKKFVETSVRPNFFAHYNEEEKTPEDIFTETHKELVQSGCQWLKSTSDSCSLVAVLIATVAFATSTALPGGISGNNGKPTLENQPAFKIFAIASLIALSSSVTSLAMFLAILTSRFQENYFGKVLPWKLLLGLTSLFLSIASMLVSFCAGYFFVFRDTLKYAAFPMYALTCVPVTLFAAAQFPFYIDLINATLRSPFGKNRPKQGSSE